jgi:two-component system LytT family response regulator
VTGRLTALIVDDERLARADLRRMLAHHAEVEVVGEASDAEEAARRIAEVRPEVLFLDVQMPGGSGFDLLERVSGRFKVVFVTAYDEHAIRAFEVNALDYLLKPVTPERLERAVNRLLSRAGGDRSPTWRLAADDHLFVVTDRQARFVKVSSIFCIRAVGDYSQLTLEGGRILVLKPLKEWEQRLPEKRFARIHRGTIVSLDHVERVERTREETFRVFVRGVPEPFPMSRRRAAVLRLNLS